MSSKKITLIATISCLAFLSMVVFKIPISFLSYEIKDVIITLGSFFIGAWASIVISFVVAILEMITVSDTGIIGFIMNFVATVSYVFPICYMYKKNSSILKGIVLGTISMAISMFLLNLIFTPIFLKVDIKETIHLLFTFITPFNIIKGGLNGFLIIILYKPLEKAMKNRRDSYEF